MLDGWVLFGLNESSIKATVFLPANSKPLLSWKNSFHLEKAVKYRSGVSDSLMKNCIDESSYMKPLSYFEDFVTLGRPVSNWWFSWVQIDSHMVMDTNFELFVYKAPYMCCWTENGWILNETSFFAGVKSLSMNILTNFQKTYILSIDFKSVYKE